MNKKLLLGLGSIATITLPVVAVVSCSSEEGKTALKGKTNLTKADFEEFKTGTVADHTDKVTNKWVKTNIAKLVEGSTDLITADTDITSASAIQNTTTGTTMDITFKVAAGKSYKADGSVTTEETTITVSVTGFEAQQSPAPTKTPLTAKSNLTIANFEEFKTGTVEANKTKVTKTWVRTNIAKLVEGSIDLITADTDITEVTPEVDTTTATTMNITFKVAAGKSYKADGSVTTEVTTITVSVTGFAAN